MLLVVVPNQKSGANLKLKSFKMAQFEEPRIVKTLCESVTEFLKFPVSHFVEFAQNCKIYICNQESRKFGLLLEEKYLFAFRVFTDGLQY